MNERARARAEELKKEISSITGSTEGKRTKAFDICYSSKVGNVTNTDVSVEIPAASDMRSLLFRLQYNSQKKYSDENSYIDGQKIVIMQV